MADDAADRLVARAIESVLDQVPGAVDTSLGEGAAAKLQPWAETAAPVGRNKRPLEELLVELEERVAADPEARADLPRTRHPALAFFDRFGRGGAGQGGSDGSGGTTDGGNRRRRRRRGGGAGRAGQASEAAPAPAGATADRPPGSRRRSRRGRGGGGAPWPNAAGDGGRPQGQPADGQSRQPGGGGRRRRGRRGRSGGGDRSPAG
jgi:hypothetical protein